MNCNFFKVLVLVFLSLSPLIICQPNFSLDDIASKKKEDLLCSICVDIVADLDNWLTSEATEDQIVEWMYRICQVGSGNRTDDVEVMIIDRHWET